MFIIPIYLFSEIFPGVSRGPICSSCTRAHSPVRPPLTRLTLSWPIERSPSRYVILYIDFFKSVGPSHWAMRRRYFLHTHTTVGVSWNVCNCMWASQDLRESIVADVTTKSKRKWGDSNRTACIRVRGKYLLATRRAYVLLMFYFKIFLMISVRSVISFSTGPIFAKFAESVDLIWSYFFDFPRDVAVVINFVDKIDLRYDIDSMKTL